MMGYIAGPLHADGALRSFLDLLFGIASHEYNYYKLLLRVPHLKGIALWLFSWPLHLKSSSREPKPPKIYAKAYKDDGALTWKVRQKDIQFSK